jgi:hypothetical protein
LYEFFVLDDSARWHAIIWSVLLGGFAGFISAQYVGTNWSVAVTALCSVGTLCVMIARYSRRRHRIVIPEHRREVLRLSLIGTVEAAAASIAVAVLWNKASAVAYAQSATDAIRSGEPVSPIRTFIAKQVIGKSLKTDQEDRPQLLRAYAQLTAAERYSHVTEMTPEVDRPPETLTAAVKITKAITLRGRGKRRTVITVGNVNSIFEISGHAFTLESIGFRARQPGISIFRFVGQPAVIVRDCLFQGFQQRLDNITWIDIEFEDCVLDESALTDTTLINVTFKNCTLPSRLASLSSPVTFSSFSDSLLE